MGAPQAAGQGRLQGSRPGALFRCPITPEEYDCERVDIDGEGQCVAQLKQLVGLFKQNNQNLYVTGH